MFTKSPLGLTLVGSRGGKDNGNPIYLACLSLGSNQGVINWKSLSEELEGGRGREGDQGYRSLSWMSYELELELP